jgi:hypothetical protein
MEGERVMDIVDRLRQRIGLVKFDSDAIALHDAANTIEQLRGQVEFASECRNGAYADAEIQNAKIERLRGVLLTVLEACKDVNSPDRKVREEITRTVRKALKEKE